MTQLSPGSSPGVYGDPKPPLVQCGESNWTGGYCRRLTRTRCPYCFRLMCGYHKHWHAMQDPVNSIACDWFSRAGVAQGVDWFLVRKGAERELRRRADLDARASDLAVQVCTVEVG